MLLTLPCIEVIMFKVLVTISLEKQYKKHTTIDEIKLPGQTITLTNELLLINYKVFMIILDF